MKSRNTPAETLDKAERRRRYELEERRAARRTALILSIAMLPLGLVAGAAAVLFATSVPSWGPSFRSTGAGEITVTSNARRDRNNLKMIGLLGAMGVAFVAGSCERRLAAWRLGREIQELERTGPTTT